MKSTPHQKKHCFPRTSGRKVSNNAFGVTGQGKIIVIVGPTASGKSDLAVQIAKKFGGEIISADSRQVYKGMDLGTGKVPRDKISKNYKLKTKTYLHKGIPHHLLDIASPKRTFTVAQYKRLALKALKDIWGRGRLPIICGGTGFYVRAVVDGLVIPEVRPNLKLRRELERKSTEELVEMLRAGDPERAGNIDLKNRRRLIRAIEIVQALGGVPKVKTEPLKAKILMLGVKKSKKELETLIRKRLLERLKQGMIREIKNLHEGGISWKRLESFGLEYKYGALYLQGRISKEELTEKIIKSSLQYAKRQMTWFKKDEKIVWFRNRNEVEKLVRSFLK